MSHSHTTQILDSFQRPLHDLRISVIDRCNFRCTYCMPHEEYGEEYQFLKNSQWLSFDEIERLVRIFVGLGVTKVRLTGGEPLLRPRIADLIRRLSLIDGIEDLALTTNGILLPQMAADLKAAGLKRLTISLDTLDEKIFAQLSGGKGTTAGVVAGIRAAEAAKFDDIKINAVIQRGVNDKSIMDLIEFFRGTNHVLRFIEYMDVGNCNHWDSSNVVPSAEILNTISKHYPLRPAKANYFGEVASRYLFEDGKGEVGFISSVSQPFCGTCTRARLSTDGKFYTCLFAQDGFDLAAPLKSEIDDRQLAELIQSVWNKRADKYSENRALFQSLKEKPRKVEMFQIGG